jgi:hypothetical protein
MDGSLVPPLITTTVPCLSAHMLLKTERMRENQEVEWSHQWWASLRAQTLSESLTYVLYIYFHEYVLNYFQ